MQISTFLDRPRLADLAKDPLWSPAHDKAVEIADAARPQLYAKSPRFQVRGCSQCGGCFGPGDAGFSRCSEHPRPAAKPAKVWTEDKLLDLAEEVATAFTFNRDRCKADLSRALNEFAIQEFGAGWDASKKDASCVL